MDDMTENCQRWMVWLGEFEPTIKGDQVKGYRYDKELGSTHSAWLSTSELGQLAEACKEMAAILNGNRFNGR